MEQGEAAFYGPKIDFVVKDVIGREWQLGTVQVDYNLPERFGLSYIGADNAALMDTWYDPHGIFDLCTVVAGSRTGAGAGGGVADGFRG